MANENLSFHRHSGEYEVWIKFHLMVKAKFKDEDEEVAAILEDITKRDEKSDFFDSKRKLITLWVE